MTKMAICCCRECFEGGLITGSTNSPSASFRTDEVTFSDGSLRQFIAPEGSFSLSLVIDGGGLTFTPATSMSVNDAALLGFSADATAQVTAQGQVPEPGSVFIFAPMLLGLLARRRSNS